MASTSPKNPATAKSAKPAAPKAAKADKAQVADGEVAEKKQRGRPAKPLNVESTWKRRSDGVEFKVVGVDETEGKITLLGGKSETPRASALKYFRRRFQHIEG